MLSLQQVICFCLKCIDDTGLEWLLFHALVVPFDADFLLCPSATGNSDITAR
jgi:hypothetical protein